MAITATITHTCPLTGVPFGSEAINPPVLTVTSALFIVQPYTLASGDNTITVPTGAKKVYILPSVGNAVAILLKKTGADAGIPLDPADWSFLSVASMSTFVLNAANSISVPFTLLFL